MRFTEIKAVDFENFQIQSAIDDIDQSTLLVDFVAIRVLQVNANNNS